MNTLREDLRARKWALEQVTSIESQPDYAEAWNMLAAEFEAIGQAANAGSCWRRFRHYRDQELEGYAQLMSPVTAVTAGVSA